MFTITKEFSFEAAHLLDGHPKCGRLHGHSYRVIVELQAEQLMVSGDNPLQQGMVRDYADLGDIKRYLDLQLDHRLLVGNEILSSDHWEWIKILPEHHWVLLHVFRTTAEEMSKMLFNMFRDRYPELTAVTVCETAKTSATYRFERGLR